MRSTRTYRVAIPAFEVLTTGGGYAGGAFLNGGKALGCRDVVSAPESFDHDDTITREV